MATKERDNTWLQLSVCPEIWRQRANTGDKINACAKDAKCQAWYAHPPSHVLKHALDSGHVVSCHAFVFSSYAPNDGTIIRSKCKFGEANCKYFHPPMNLGLQVINMGRNNKRMRQEMLSKVKTSSQQFWASPPIVYLPTGSPNLQDPQLRKRRSKTPPPGINPGDNEDSNSPQAKRKSIEDPNAFGQATLVPSSLSRPTYPAMYYYPPPPGFAWVGATPAVTPTTTSAGVTGATSGVPLVPPGWEFHASHFYHPQ